MQVKTRNNLIYILVLLFFLILFIMIWLWANPVTVEIPVNTENSADKISEDKTLKETVRISFYNTKKYRLNLAIPADWEGNYRVKESGNKVDFSYIGSNRESINFLSIIYNEKESAKEMVEGNDGEIFIQNDQVYFTYKLSTSDISENEENIKLEQMTREVAKVIESAKIN